MADKALVALRGAPQDATNVVTERTDAVAAGCNIEFELPQGILVRGVLTQFTALAAQGYWVRVLRNTDILAVGQYQLNILAAPPHVPPDLEIPAPLVATWRHHLVQLAAPPIDAWNTQIVATGAKIVMRISDYGLFLDATAAQMHQVSLLPFVAWSTPFRPAYRVAQALNGITGTIADLVVLTYPAAAITPVAAAIVGLGGSIISSVKRGAVGRVMARLDALHMAAIATRTDVYALDYVPEGVRLLDERSCQVLSGGPLAVTSPGYDPQATFGVDGRNVTIAIADTGIDAAHADFSGRVIYQESFDPNSRASTDALGHGTHVAGIAAGNASAAATVERDTDGFALGQGMAPAASLVSIKINKDIGAAPPLTGFPESLPTDIPTWTQRAVKRGSHIMNNSWESVSAGGYDSVCQDVDLAVRDVNATTNHGPLVMVCGAGNSGLTGIVAPGFAKNAITVAACWSTRQPTAAQAAIEGGMTLGIPKSTDFVWPSSSAGPVPAPGANARILPTVVAPGTYITSAKAACAAAYVDLDGHQFATHAMGGTLLTQGLKTCVVGGATAGLSGTSYSAPHVAGMCALLIDAWRTRSGGLIASPALLKAWIINGAVDTGVGSGVHIPNNRAGWGRANLSTTLNSPGGQRLFIDQTYLFTDPADVFVLRVTAIDTAKPMRITLVWTDPPVQLDNTGKLSHNLDLEVEERNSGGTQMYLGNKNFVEGFSTAAAATDFADDLNNTECVYLRSPRALDYTIRVVPGSVSPSDTQDFALVVENAERLTSTPVSVVVLMDRSGSMIGSAYDAPARTAANTFIGGMAAGNEIGIVSFAGAAIVEFAMIRSDSTRRRLAQTAVNAIAFGGCTYLGDGIQASRQILSASANPAMAIVLLSDGYDNQGCQLNVPGQIVASAAATAAPVVPIHTCALGPASDQVFMQSLAASTNGLYYYSPSELDLQDIYGFIAGDVSGDDIITLETVQASNYTLRIPIDDSVSSVTVQVTWDNPGLAWVSSTPRSTEIEVALIDPAGRRWNPHNCHTQVVDQPGSLTLKIDRPPQGVWKMYIATRIQKHTRCSVGVFARSSNHLNVSPVKPVVAVGDPITLTATGFMTGAGLGSTVSVKARVSRPDASLDDVEETFKTALNHQPAATSLTGDGIPTRIAKLVALHRRRKESGGTDIFQVRESSITFAVSPGGAFSGMKTAAVSGTYNFVVTASLKGPQASAIPIVRKKLVSVLVVP